MERTSGGLVRLQNLTNGSGLPDLRNSRAHHLWAQRLYARMKKIFYRSAAAIICITLLAFLVVNILGDNPIDRDETAYVLEYIKNSKDVADITGEILDLQIDPGDWRISEESNGVQAMYGVYVSGKRANIKFRIYWESKKNSIQPQVYKITIVGKNASKDQEVWTMKAE